MSGAISPADVGSFANLPFEKYTLPTLRIRESEESELDGAKAVESAMTVMEEIRVQDDDR